MSWLEKIKSGCQSFTDYLRADKFCLHVLISQSIVMFVIIIYVGSNGSPAKVSQGFDPDHFSCGYDLGYEDFPYIYFATPQMGYLYRTVCLAQCPSIKGLPDDSITLSCRPNSQITQCAQNTSIFDHKYQIQIYDTFTYKENICMPTAIYYYETIQEAANPPPAHQNVHDLFHTRYIVTAAGAALSYIVTRIVMLILDYYFRIVSWVLIAGAIIGFAVGGVMFCLNALMAYNVMTNPQPNVTTIQVTPDYILNVSNSQSFVGNIFLSILFVGLFMYSCNLLYYKFQVVETLNQILTLADKFLDEKKNKNIKQLSMLLSAVLLVCFIINYFLLIYLLSCIDIDQTPNQLPFLQDIPQLFQLILFPISCFTFLFQTNLCVSVFEYVSVASMTKWLGSKIRQPQSMIVEPQNGQSVIRNQEQKEDFVKASVKEMYDKKAQIITVSFWVLVLSPLKLIISYILSNVNNMKNEVRKLFIQQLRIYVYLKNFYETYLRGAEPVVYVELSQKDMSVLEAQKALIEVLNKDKNQDVYEQLSNLSRGFIFIVVFVSCLVFFKLTSYYNNLLYSDMVPTMIVAIFSYFVGSIHINLYGLAGQTFIYNLFQREKMLEEQKFAEIIQQLSDKECFPELVQYFQSVRSIQQEPERAKSCLCCDFL